jgi:hypothetical protein
MNNKQFWITVSLANLCIAALLGFTLRSKILFPLPFINYQYLVDAHSHFAFGGFITLALLNLLTHTLLPPVYRQRKWYQWMMWGLTTASFGMLFSFPFTGYATASIIFSTLLIFFTYGYGACFIRDVLKLNYRHPAYMLALGAMVYLIISSAGPFTLAYIKASGSANSILYKDAIYYYLHCQYNGFFTLSVFALLIFAAYPAGANGKVPAPVKWFTGLLNASVLPSFFLSLLYHADNIIVKTIALLGVVLIIGCLINFFRAGKTFPVKRVYTSSLAKGLLFLAMVSFVIKSILQTGTIFPGLGNAVFGLRPIIIGFLHLVFLGLVCFYILSNYIGAGAFNTKRKFVRLSIQLFAAAVIIQEMILLVQGVGLLLGNYDPIYAWLLWGVSILLATGAVLMFMARLKSRKETNPVHQLANGAHDQDMYEPLLYGPGNNG